MHDALRDSQDLLEPAWEELGMVICPVDLSDWSVRAVPKLLAAIASRKPDIILIQYPTGAFGHSLGPPLLSLIQMIAPCIVMLHEFTAAHILRKLAVGALVSRATLIALTAEREEVAIARMYPWIRGRTRLIPITSNIPRREWSPQGTSVVYFGQLRPNKGIEEFLQAKAILAERFPEVTFEMFGAVIPRRADYAEWLTTEAAKQGIAIHQNLDIETVSERLSKATVALLPFPGGTSMRRSSMLAAAGCGTPIVTTTGEDTPASLANYIQHASSVDDLVALCTKYLSDPAELEAAHMRSLRLASTIGLDATVASYCAVFNEVALRKATGSRRELSHV